jgi:hypothetical protein
MMTDARGRGKIDPETQGRIATWVKQMKAEVERRKS